jgi:predicted secreted protein
VSERRVGPEAAGRTVQVAAGDRLLVALPEIPGTGYTWQAEELPPGAAVLDERYEQPPDAGIGATALHVFVIDPGEGGPLRLRQGPPWLGEEGVVERFEVTVERA